MAGMTKAQLEARLHELESENARLQEAIDENARLRASLETAAPAPGPVSAAAAPGPAPASARGRAFLGVLLIVLGTLVAPLATVSAYAARMVGDTDVFVATLAPLAEDPDVQAFVVDEATAAIDEALDTDALVEDLLASVIDEGSTPRLANAADVLGPLLADQARVAIRSALTQVVGTEAFVTVWEQALALAHAQVVGVLEADADGAVTIDETGVVALQLAPIIDELRPALVDAGFTLADSIPTVDVSVTLAEVPKVAQARLGYSILKTVGSVLPWIALALIAAGILVHPRRPRASIVAGTLLLIVGATLALVLATAGDIVAAAIATEVPTATTGAIYGAVTAEPGAVLIAYVVAGAVAILAGLVLGRSSAAASARERSLGWADRGASALDERGWRSPAVGALLRRRGWLLWIWLAAVFLLLYATLRPFTPVGVVLGTLVIALAGAVFAVLRAESSPEGAAEGIAEDGSGTMPEGAPEEPPAPADDPAI
ncbi:bZIP transcription factor [Demequina mangrovi]|uniref:Uncharacterized protein n=1 Tax=Demequina mangrovi TaxID=1043493 RepID=A0A1H6Z1X6_9MICO|nr:bZIP transcription factor [Demequina mangrovi]SEJ45397.1 hypothetical protein SAMN05421637_1827 [Demequina mangrovi]